MCVAVFSAVTSRNSWPCAFTGHLGYGSDTCPPRNCSASLKIISVNLNIPPYTFASEIPVKPLQSECAVKDCI